MDDSSCHPLPQIPGGWQTGSVSVGTRSISLIRPAVPDLFLDDERVIAANRETDYMPYWSYLWPAASVMAETILGTETMLWAERFAGERVLELGCGVGLVGVAAGLIGGVVTFSDYDPVAAACAVENARLNHLPSATGMVFDWRNPPSQQWPIIIGCDLLYERRDQSLLLDCLDHLLAPEGLCWIGDPGRIPSAEFLPLARARGFQVRLIDRDQVEHDAFQQGVFQIIELGR